jgi:cytochrome b6-f complex iron-sulfur subunit
MNGETEPRRSFLRWVVVGWTALAVSAGAFGWMCLRYLFPSVSYEREPRFTAGTRSEYPDAGKVYERFKETQGVWLVRLTEDGQDRLIALAASCTHLGCVPNWLEAEGRFKCPCHGSGFRRDGANFEGPAPRPLERCGISVDSAGRIVVDKGRRFRKERGQCSDPASYVVMS